MKYQEQLKMYSAKVLLAITTLKQKINALPHKKRVVISLSVAAGVVVSSATAFSLMHHSNTLDSETALTQQLMGVDSLKANNQAKPNQESVHLTSLVNDVISNNKASTKLFTDKFEAQQQRIDKQSLVLNKLSTDSQEEARLLTTLDHRIDLLNRNINQVITLENATAAARNGLVNPKELPFKIEAIDIINGENIVSVSYDNKITPIAKNLTLAGWKLIDSNYQNQSATFADHDGKQVSINLRNE